MTSTSMVSASGQSLLQEVPNEELPLELGISTSEILALSKSTDQTDLSKFWLQRAQTFFQVAEGEDRTYHGPKVYLTELEVEFGKAVEAYLNENGFNANLTIHQEHNWWLIKVKRA